MAITDAVLDEGLVNLTHKYSCVQPGTSKHIIGHYPCEVRLVFANVGAPGAHEQVHAPKNEFANPEGVYTQLDAMHPDAGTAVFRQAHAILYHAVAVFFMRSRS